MFFILSTKFKGFGFPGVEDGSWVQRGSVKANIAKWLWCWLRSAFLHTEELDPSETSTLLPISGLKQSFPYRLLGALSITSCCYYTTQSLQCWHRATKVSVGLLILFSFLPLGQGNGVSSIPSWLGQYFQTCNSTGCRTPNVQGDIRILQNLQRSLEE